MMESSYRVEGGFDFCEGDKSSLGFMELLGMQDCFDSSSFDMMQVPSMVQPVVVGRDRGTIAREVSKQKAMDTSTKESVEVGLSQLTTPNSPSISSVSSEGLNENTVSSVKVVEDKEQENDEKLHKTTIKDLKPKKMANKKRQREPRIAFMTKSEVDHLEDGYRWRKYGQKAVKNSPFPRSYYRCTTTSCNVKKRVERSFNDPSIVMTTYEGQHTHPSPVATRPSLARGVVRENNVISLPVQNSTTSFYNQQQVQHPRFDGFSLIGPDYDGNMVDGSQERSCNSTGRSGLFMDYGLLQDIVSCQMAKEN